MLFEFRVVQLASGLTLSIAGVFKEVLTIVSSVHIFGDQLTPFNVAGLLICLAGIGGYQRLKLLEAHTQGNVPHRLKELMRIQLARFVDDPHFASLRSKQAVADGMTEEMIDAATDDYEDSEMFSEAERMALRFSEQLFLDADKVDNIFYDQMREHYSDAQIMEIGAFVATYYAIQLFMKTLNAQPVAA